MTPRRRELMVEAAILPDRCPGCQEPFEAPPRYLYSGDDATWCHTPKLLPCLHTVSAAYLQEQVETHEEVNRLLLHEACKEQADRRAQLDAALMVLEEDQLNSRQDLVDRCKDLDWFHLEDRRYQWLLKTYESWPESKRVAWLRNLLHPDRKSEVRCPVCDEFFGVHQGGVDGLPNNYLVLRNISEEAGQIGEEKNCDEFPQDIGQLEVRREDTSSEDQIGYPALSKELSPEQEELKMQIMQLQHENAVLKSNMERTLIMHADHMRHGTVKTRIQQMIDNIEPLIEDHESVVDSLRASISNVQSRRRSAINDMQQHFAELRSQLDERERYLLAEINKIADSHLQPIEKDLSTRLHNIQDGRTAVRLSKQCLEEDFNEDHLAEMEQPMVEKLDVRQSHLRGFQDSFGNTREDIHIEFEVNNERIAKIKNEVNKLGAILTEASEPPRQNTRKALGLPTHESSGIYDISFTINTGIPHIGESNRRFHEDYDQYFICVRGKGIRNRTTEEAKDVEDDDELREDEEGDILGCVEIITRTRGPAHERWDHSTQQGFQTYGEESKGEVPVIRFTKDTVFGRRYGE